MIAGVVATLEQGSCGAPDIVYEISKLPGVEVGVIGSHGRRLPITIDSPDQNALEEITRRLQECPGVAFVDVVFVHLEEEPDSPTAVFPEGTSRP